MSGLKLSALDADDLDVISAAVQDALVAVQGQADQKRLLGYVIARQGEPEQGEAQPRGVEVRS